MNFKDKRYIVLFLSPTVILLFAFLLYPLIQSVYYSFTDWYNFSNKKTFIGLDNYRQLVQDPVVGIALRNTLILIVGAIVLQAGGGLALALLTASVKRGFKFFRTVYFFPIVISGTAIGLMFSIIYNYDYGLLNAIMRALGLPEQVWLTEHSSIYLVLIPILWQYVGFYFVIFLTGISKIPEDIYESAQLDGITGIQKAFKITIPLLRDVIASCLTLATAGALKVFDVVYIVTKGGPMNSSELLSTYMYDKAFNGQNAGYASTIVIAMMLLGILITVLLNKAVKKDTISY
ncbi:ABC transporter permease [Cohnella sp. CIP 111063]|uniref:carbohydrate ABC transporter permease n=1 Tax=unclassified Cohnella TaxID=2636738 RepID=UPI000B8C35F8|nr:MULTISPECIES: sugar ABC transporter permease [unclassified Cohnella]OXS59806.1 ABC transporter permease [Cohnella sp. CIP 111063]PRX72598.1 raffinose/stachyose/melibiose transport system permease protein [Cohnella sp. SGD-V74]